MKPLITSLLISLSGVCSQGSVAIQERGYDSQPVSNMANARMESPVQASQKSASDWCTCALSVEEQIFLQQYDFN